MTSVSISRGELVATGHAGDRDACISATAMIKAFAHVLAQQNCLMGYEVDESVPRTRVAWDPHDEVACAAARGARDALCSLRDVKPDALLVTVCDRQLVRGSAL